MEEQAHDPYLTTTQAAGLLGVHASTIKRWCDDGELQVYRTDGGHRRLRLMDVLALSERRDVGTYLSRFTRDHTLVWEAVEAAADTRDFGRAHELARQWLLDGYLEGITQLFVAIGTTGGVPLARLFDLGIRGFMSELGSLWEAGTLRVGQEHLASQAIVEALLELRARLVDVPGGNGVRSPSAIVGAIEGDQHHIGALAIRLLLEQAGWQTFYLGADVPIEEFADLQQRHGARLVCISFSPPHGRGDVVRCLRVLGKLYTEDSPYALAVGGSLPVLPEIAPSGLPFESFTVFQNAEDFSRWLARRRAGGRTPARLGAGAP